nr:hypothetical protein [Tanacetum cinerariifolium]
MVFRLVDGVRASDVEIIYEMNFVRRVSEIKDAFGNKLYKLEDIKELCRKLFNDVQNIHEELAEYINTASSNHPAFYNNDEDNDKEFSIPMSEIYEKSDKFIKSSVENLVQNPSESEDKCECNVPDCDDSQTTIFSTFSIPLFDNSTSSDDESSHEDVIHEMNFKTYSNPLLDLDEEIISSEFNPIHNEDLDSTPKNDRFDTKYYLLESLLNRDTLMASSPKIDSFLDEFAGELITIPPRIVNIEHEEYISLMERLLYDNSSPQEIDLILASDGSIPSGIDSDYSDFEEDNLFPERLLHDDPIPLSDILDFSNVDQVFLPFYTYSVTSLILLSSGSEDTIFDPSISNYHFSSLEPGVSHQSGSVMKFNVYPNHLNKSSMEILSSNCFPMDQ